MHADVANLEFLGKSAVDPKYCLPFIDHFTAKVYTYPMKTGKLLSKKMSVFYEDVEAKRKGKKVCLQTDQEFLLNGIKHLNIKRNAEMFSTRVRGGKAFTAERKIMELKKRLHKIRTIKKRIGKRLCPIELITTVTKNMSDTKSEKYGLELKVIENKSLEDDLFGIKHDFHRMTKVKKDEDRKIRHGQKIDCTERNKLRESLRLGEKILVLAEHLKKRDAPNRF